MNGTPRGLNRVLLTLIGVLFLAAGALALALATTPAVALWWQGWAHGAADQLSQEAARTTLPGNGGSWLWIVVSLLLVLVVVGMVAWVANQGKGRANILADEYDEDAAAGRVAISGSVAEQALKDALGERTDLLGATVTTYEVQGQPALKVRILPRQGVSPREVAAEVSALVEALDLVLGIRTPVLISIGAGARARFTRAERVR
ncbi:MAG TPA: hypothetical protein VGN49_02350 [Micrococcaceae bacterium]|jgi:hypothetical protein|nr:hypothetical protein [Micrococcaceae bacterium]